MRGRAVVATLAVLAAAGCGGARQAAAPEPKLPRALAQSWAQQADAVAASIDAGDGCTAQLRAVGLQTQVVQAVDGHQVPRRFVEPLVAAANDLVARIACTPAPVVTTHGKQGKNGKHGKNGGGD